MGCCFATAASEAPSRENQERQEAALPKGNAGNPDLEAKSALLEQEKQRLGPEHPEVAAILNNLANAHGDLGDLSHTERLAGASVEDQRAALRH